MFWIPVSWLIFRYYEIIGLDVNEAHDEIKKLDNSLNYVPLTTLKGRMVTKDTSDISVSESNFFKACNKLLSIDQTNLSNVVNRDSVLEADAENNKSNKTFCFKSSVCKDSINGESRFFIFLWYNRYTWE